jgi:hypothetical protein
MRKVWGPASIQKGVGGSEEAAIHLSRELSKRGFCVIVYGNPPVQVLCPADFCMQSLNVSKLAENSYVCVCVYI